MQNPTNNWRAIPRNRPSRSARIWSGAWALVLGSVAAAWAVDSPTAPCPRCGWRPTPARVEVRVRSLEGLKRSIALARPGMTILLEDGVYELDQMLDVSVPGLVLRGRGGDRRRVVLRGT